ncbi:MAG: DUF3299 domain-containing protein [Planctomycetota bacterium]|jgi:hypothetical protein
MNPNPTEAVQDRHLELMLAELGGRDAPADCRERVASALAGAARTRPRMRLLRPLVAVAAAGIVVAVAWCARGQTPAAAPTPPTPTTNPQPIASAAPVKPAPKENHPKGTDPADLAAARGADAMLAAERKVAAMVADGKLPAQPMSFARLSDWDYTNGLVGMPEDVQALAGTTVTFVGFMLPIDEVTSMTQFLLVQSLWSCCYGTPPDLHEIVRCVLPAGQTTDYSFEPLLLTGTLTVGPTVEDGYVVDVFQLQVSTITPLPY